MNDEMATAEVVDLAGRRLLRSAAGGATTVGTAVVGLGERFLDQVGGMTAMALEAIRRTWDVRQWWREWLDQCWFLFKVTSVPTFLIALPLGATIALEVGQLTRQLGAQSATGTAVVTGMIAQVAPVASALLISGAGGSAMASDTGARRIRDELSAMEVMCVNPTHRLVTPRIWAASTVAVLLVSLVVVSGVAGGYFFNVIIQHVTPGAYFGNATALLQLPDLGVSLFKAWIFGLIAAIVACYRGMNCNYGPVGVGQAVKQAVVQTFIIVFIANFVITTLYVLVIPPRLA
jgi:phospholipid/cholesterol/gamma-HCH transport system permease protein